MLSDMNPMHLRLNMASASMRDEQKRKIRIAAGAFQAMIILKGLFNIFRYPGFIFSVHFPPDSTMDFMSLVSVLCFISNAWLVWGRAGEFYLVFFLLQTVFYAIAWAGWIMANRNLKIKAFYIPYYFLFMNLSVFHGLLQIGSGKNNPPYGKKQPGIIRHKFWQCS